MGMDQRGRTKSLKRWSKQKHDEAMKAKVCREEIVTIKGRPVKITVYAQKKTDTLSDEDFKNILEELAEDYKPPTER